MEYVFDLLSYGFMQRALVAGLASAVVCGLISCWITYIGWSLMGDAISHAVLPGVVLAHVIGIPYLLGALVSALIAVGLINRVRDLKVVKADTAMGIVFTTLFSLGTVMISRISSQVNLTHILFGNLLGVTTADMWQILILGTVVAVIVLVKAKDLTLFCFDAAHAQAIGLNPQLLSQLLLICLAATVVVSLSAVGVILSVALLVIPGACARLLTSRMWKMLFVSPLIAIVSVLLGLTLSYVFDASSGGMIGLVLGGEFAFAYLFGAYGYRLQRK